MLALTLVVPTLLQLKPIAHDKQRRAPVALLAGGAEEGEQERQECYQPLIDALLKFLPYDQNIRADGSAPRVLCPGSGLGRGTPWPILKASVAPDSTLRV